MGNKSKVPKILIVEELIADLSSNCDEMEKYTNSINLDNYKCNFIYIYSLFEGALWQLAKSILFAFPEMLNKEKLQIGDGELSLDGCEMIEHFVENKLRMISTGKLASHFEEIMKIANIRVNYDIDVLNSISRARNIIVHTNTTKLSNKFNAASVPVHPCFLDAKEHTKALKELLESVKKAISCKYKDYTHKKLLEEAWNYTVGGYMGFNNIVGFDKSFGDKIVVRPNFDLIEEALKGFCSTEKTMLTIWMHQYNSEFHRHKVMSEICDLKAWAWLDREKLVFLVNLFNRFPHLMDGQDYSKDLKG